MRLPFERNTREAIGVWFIIIVLVVFAIRIASMDREASLTDRIVALEEQVDSLRLRTRKQPPDSEQQDSIVRAERDSIVTEAALKYGVDPRIAVAVARVEVPSGDSMAISYAGAIGIMQVIPHWWEHYRALICEDRSLFDRQCSAEVGVFILLTHYKTFGDWPSALRAYNTGSRAQSRAGRSYIILVEARLGEALE